MNRRFIGIFNVLMAFALVASCVSKGPDDAAAMTLNAPENLTLVANDGKSMKFKWTEVEGAEGYTARLELASGTLQKQLSVKVNEVVFDGLTSGTAYSVKVKAYSGSVVSDYCEAMEVVAGSTDPSPDPDPEPDPEPDPDPTPDPTPDPDKDAAYSQLMIPSYESENLALAFPGAEGGGMYATGGRGGKAHSQDSFLQDRWRRKPLYQSRRGISSSCEKKLALSLVSRRWALYNSNIPAAGMASAGEGGNGYDVVGHDDAAVRPFGGCDRLGVGGLWLLAVAVGAAGELCGNLAGAFPVGVSVPVADVRGGAAGQAPGGGQPLLPEAGGCVYPGGSENSADAGSYPGPGADPHGRPVPAGVQPSQRYGSADAAGLFPPQPVGLHLQAGESEAVPGGQDHAQAALPADQPGE